jgi:glucose/arabinose dehydrogenase
MKRTTGIVALLAAIGVRNSVGQDFNPKDKTLWFTDNQIGGMGDDTQPGELNRVTKPGQHFGYPYMHSLKADGTADRSEVFAEGWLDPNTNTYRGQPVDVAVMKDGSLLVSDDYAGAIYRISYQQ